MLEPMVASAIATGVLDKAKVPPEILDFLARHIQFHGSGGQ
jgi:hypothetical protein